MTKNKKKSFVVDIVIFTPTLKGGLGKVVTNLATGLDKKGWEVDILTISTDSIYLKELPDSVKIIDFKLNKISKSFLKLVAYLKKTKPKILLSASYHANIIALLAKLLSRVETKVFVSEHIALRKALKNINFLKRFTIYLLIKFFYPLANGIIVVSDGVAKDIIKITKIPQYKIKTIYNPVIETKIYKYSEKIIDKKFNKIFSDDLPIILGVGRLTKQKDFQTLIKAFSIVKRKINSKLLILGEGQERPSLENLIKKLSLEKNVFLPGFVPNPYPFFKKADIFVLSSAWEGFGIVLVESLALGTSIVSTNCPSGPKEILENGKYGKLVPIKDVNALAEAIIKTLSNNISNSQLLMSRARDFSVEKSIEKYEKIFKEIL